jgi:hypothetical protein
MHCGEQGSWPPRLTGHDGYVKLVRAIVRGVVAAQRAVAEVSGGRASFVHVEAAFRYVGETGAFAEEVELLRARQFLVQDLLRGRVDDTPARRRDGRPGGGPPGLRRPLRRSADGHRDQRPRRRRQAPGLAGCVPGAGGGPPRGGPGARRLHLVAPVRPGRLGLPRSGRSGGGAPGQDGPVRPRGGRSRRHGPPANAGHRPVPRLGAVGQVPGLRRPSGPSPGRGPAAGRPRR